TAAARSAGARVVWEPRRGYGRACLTGAYASPHADIIVQMDGDGSDVPEDILRVWGLVRSDKADLAMGSRTRGHHERGALTPQQIAGNAVGTSLLRLLYGTRLSDIGPLRAIRRETLLRLQMAEMTYGWSAEMLVKAARLGLRVTEVPVDYRRRAGGKSKVAGTLTGTVKASYSILSTILRYARWRPDENERVVRGKARRALFIVARLPVVGQTKTRLAGDIGAEAATDLYRAFLRDLGERFTVAAARSGYDLVWYYTAPAEANERDFAACVPVGTHFLRQGDGELGERLWRGFQALHAQGYEQIVVLGSDSPQVPAAWIDDAFRLLDTHDVVIGPAHDGGYYLLGQRGEPVDLFTPIPMSTSTVCAQTVDLAWEIGRSVARAPATFDIDYVADLAALQAALESASSSDADMAPETLAYLRLIVFPDTAQVEGVAYAD
ncbi:MAG TPA: TIGR04282 family arsenosugar biosynthesis glycosyltransferase, partial [Ktedonobacterales bacterium]|nr:TIGR04282 family arsenosugar biosynthesis glycosyltransferase [Ktedonobacterales bacterium]